MAITTVTPVQLVKDTVSADLPIASGTAINPANTMELAYPIDGKLLIVLNNTTVGAKVVTISAGDFVAKGQGALALSLAQDDVKFIVLSSDRFKKNDGVIELSFESGMTGFVQAFYVPY